METRRFRCVGKLSSDFPRARGLGCDLTFRWHLHGVSLQPQFGDSEMLVELHLKIGIGVYWTTGRFGWQIGCYVMSHYLFFLFGWVDQNVVWSNCHLFVVSISVFTCSPILWCLKVKILFACMLQFCCVRPVESRSSVLYVDNSLSIHLPIPNPRRCIQLHH